MANAITSMVSVNVCPVSRDQRVMYHVQTDIMDRIAVKCANVKMVPAAERTMATVCARRAGWERIVKMVIINGSFFISK